MLVDKNICTGCGACAISCPIKCIEMKVDREGFRYPVVDVVRCIACRKCETVCPILFQSLVRQVPQAYAAKNRDSRIRSMSSSGGVFPTLAEFVLERGGAVCAAAYTDDFSVEHQIVENVTDMGKLQGAKYAQSCTEHLFPKIRRILEVDRWLLYVGTPCQTAGLKAYLGKDYSKLLLVDMICHGVPSPHVWKKYLIYRIKKDANKCKIVAINQRDKVSGWSKYRYSVRIDYNNGKSYCMPQSQDVFMCGFVNNLFLRPSCSNCKFKGFKRCADITLGDYWGVWEQHPGFDDDKGSSLVLIHTQKGRQVYDEIRDCLEMISVGAQESLHHNPSAYMSAEPHPKRDDYFEKLEKTDFEKLVLEMLFGVPEKRHFLRKLIQRFLCSERKE